MDPSGLFLLVLAAAAVLGAVFLFGCSRTHITGVRRPYGENQHRTLLVPGEYPTIQGAIDAAQRGDRIVVAPGTYDENIDFCGKQIHITSVDPNDPATVARTIIDGGRRDSVVVFVKRERAGAVLEGFTLANGVGRAVFEKSILGNAARVGGGIYVGSEASPTVRLNVVRDNQADLGGGVYITSNSLALFENNTVTQNRAILGGGIRAAWDFRLGPNGAASNRQRFFGQHFAIIQLCSICHNEANIGGGVSVDRSAAPVVADNDIGHNVARWDGGAMAIWDSSKPRVVANKIHDNHAGSTYGYGGGISVINNSKPTIENNVLENNCATGEHASGGGALAVNSSEPIVRCNRFGGNNALEGAAVYVWGNSDPLMAENELSESDVVVREYQRLE